MTSTADNIVYIARDIERALGKEPLGNYFIITNKTPYSIEILKKYPNNVWLIDSPKLLDTYELLSLPEVEKALLEHKPRILVFKNTIHIEELCRDKSFKLLNPSATTSEKIENKISQVSWLGELTNLLPPHKIQQAKDIVWENKVVVLQWSHGHTGDGTLLIQNENDLNVVKDKFPHREARVTDFIKGPMFTVNIVVNDSSVLLGNISYQITGVLPFTENPMSTIGNDWSLPHTILSDSHIEKIQDIARKIGVKMYEEQWKGLFGIDVIYDEERDQIYLIEINARQPASTTFESELQTFVRSNGVSGVTIFEAHLNALINKKSVEQIIEINDGAQILQRVTSKIQKVKTAPLIELGYKVIEYSNSKLNSDLLRIQSQKGIMETHNKFNGRGKEISDSIFLSL